MGNEGVSSRDLFDVLAKSQKVTNALALAVSHLAIGDTLLARDTLEEVAELAKESQWSLAMLAYNAGLVERG